MRARAMAPIPWRDGAGAREAGGLAVTLRLRAGASRGLRSAPLPISELVRLLFNPDTGARLPRVYVHTSLSRVVGLRM